MVRKCLVRPFLSANQLVWKHLPESATTRPPLHSYGNFLQSLVRRFWDRNQYYGTFFLRNRPELALMRDLAFRKGAGAPVKIAVIGCSNGAEVYSILWTIHSARPDIRVTLHAVDISSEIMAIAERGVYSLGANEMMDSAIFERLSEQEMREIFDQQNGQVSVKSWIRDGVDFQVADAGDPGLVEKMGLHQIVVANRFLCHMAPADAERCLRNLVRLVEPGGYLFVSGVDLDVRTKVAHDLGWVPVPDLIEEIHDGDPSVRRDWPWKWWGLEPFTKSRRDWSVRYASVFKIGGKS